MENDDENTDENSDENIMRVLRIGILFEYLFKEGISNLLTSSQVYRQIFLIDYCWKHFMKISL